jgi:hypothetical protein
LSEVGAIASRAIKQDANSALRPEHFSCTVAGTGHLMQAMRDAWITLLHVREIGVAAKQAARSLGFCRASRVDILAAGINVFRAEQIDDVAPYVKRAQNP